ncbi:AMP-binding protein, partial [Bergeriella denitrificans]
MTPLTQILNPTLPADDLIAVSPAWTRAEFNRAVFALSGRLKNGGIQTAALWFDDAAQFACALLAVWHAGAEARLLPNTAAENIAWAAAADVVLTDAAAVFAGGNSDGLKLWRVEENPAMPSETPAGYRIAPTARACLKTSGSSGEAQIVVKTAAQMEAEALALAAAVPFAQQGLHVVGSVSPQHMYGLTFRFALALTLGWTTVRAQTVYPETLLAATAAQDLCVWIASPALLNRLGAGRNWAAVQGKIAGIVSAGGALPQAAADVLAQYAVRPYEIYGSTETGVIASRQDGGLWQPFAQAAVMQQDDGTLAVESPWTQGLWRSADAIETDHLSDGFILLGRQDRVMKFEDKRVSLVQIEHLLLQHEWIADAHCAPHPLRRRPAVWAALSGAGIAALREQGRAAVADTLRRCLAASLDKAVLPRFWRFTDALPRNAQSKIAAADFQTAFTRAQTAPVWTERPSENHHGGVRIFGGRIPLDLTYFGGHFAKFPLVPGVVELQWVRDLAARFEWGRQAVVRVENLKFQQFVRPHDEIVLTLQYDEEKNKAVFKISNGEGASCASGRLVFGVFEAV